MKGPNFFIVGVVKGGTTSLYRYLVQHPQVYMSPVKETNFFSRDAIDTNLFTKDYKHDVDVNLKEFLQSDFSEIIHIAHVIQEEDYNLLFKKVKDEIAIGEISNSYILYPGVAEKIYHFNPQAKIIMILRNPSERAFSQYLMNLRQGKTLNKNFIEEVLEDSKKPHQGWGASHQYLFIGNYYEQVKRYFDVFPKDQVKIFLYDDYKENPAAVLEKMRDFLGIEDFTFNTNQKYNEAGLPRFSKINYLLNQTGVISWAKNIFPHHWRAPLKKLIYREGNIPKLQNDERQWLINYYKEDILKLEKLIERDLSKWVK